MATETWNDYSKLVLKELERLNDDSSKLRVDMDSKFSEVNQKLTEINYKLSEIRNIEGKVDNHSKWIETVNDVWSPTQMKEAKDEIYKQKNRWIAAIAILTFIQIAVGIVLSIWSKLK
jgi:hypothetical protein